MSLAPRLDILEASVAGNKPNLLINGAFDLWQRNFGGVTGINQYGADRWRQNSATASTSRLTRVETPGLPITSLHGCGYTSIAGGGNIAQRIEAANVRPYVGQFLTLQFRAGLVSGTPNFSVIVRKPNATDDWTGSTVVYNSGNLGVPAIHTGSYSTYYYTFLVDADMGAKGIGIELGNDTSVWAAVFAEVMLTPGINAIVPFQRAGRNFQEELAMAQRYYEKSYEVQESVGTVSGAGVRVIGVAGVGEVLSGSVLFKTTKRASPLVVSYRTNALNVPNAALGTAPAGGATNNRTSVIQSSRSLGFFLSIIGTTTETIIDFAFTADAEL